QGAPATAEYFAGWEAAAQAYNSGNGGAWNTATANLRAQSDKFTDSGKVELELAYNALHPLNLALAFYLLSSLVFAVHAMRDSGASWLYRTSAALLAAGAVTHTAAILMRVEILSRPPVGTLYESIIFVALVCVLIGAGWEARKKNGSGLLLAAVSGMVLLCCAMGFASEDTLQVLVAVLNTNFWLATHVLCITMGYGWCIAASMVAHAYLYERAKGRSADTLFAPVKILSLIALLFTAVGTILGGIWADQSWGRFWGWDPKENGALLIVLWLVWILHARIAGQIGRPLFMAGMAAVSVIVALAWFGVNLLSVGLHSYGFIDGIALGLSLFCAAEAALIGGLYYLGRKRAA
ncbi:MAG: cytochrome C assembly protein, partial [Micavibrio aeruginosavorus]